MLKKKERNGIKVRANLITRDERADKTKSSGNTWGNFLGGQLKQSDRHHYVHACFNEGQWPFIRFFEFSTVLLILKLQTHMVNAVKG